MPKRVQIWKICFVTFAIKEVVLLQEGQSLNCFQSSFLLLFNICPHFVNWIKQKKIKKRVVELKKVIYLLAVSSSKESLYKEIQENSLFSISAPQKFLKYMTLRWLKDSQEPKLGNDFIPVQPCHGSCGSACEQEGENGWTFASVVQSIRE